MIETEEANEYAINYIKDNLERIYNGFEIQQPAASEHFEIMAFVQQMLKILTDLNDIETSACIKHNIGIYQELLKSLYSAKIGA